MFDHSLGLVSALPIKTGPDHPFYTSSKARKGHVTCRAIDYILISSDPIVEKEMNIDPDPLTVQCVDSTTQHLDNVNSMQIPQRENSQEYFSAAEDLQPVEPANNCMDNKEDETIKKHQEYEAHNHTNC